MITPEQIKAARLMLGWNVETLATRATVSSEVVRWLELGWTGSRTAQWRVMLALESAGVVFVPETGGATGVRLKDEREP